MKLKGHTDNVKSLLLNRDGTQVTDTKLSKMLELVSREEILKSDIVPPLQCLSGSSDGTIRLWSLGQQRCIATYRVHDEGVWALQVNEAFTHVYSGGRDKKIYCTDLRNPDIRVLICEEKAPVLKVSTQNAFTWRCHAAISGNWHNARQNYLKLNNCMDFWNCFVF